MNFNLPHDDEHAPTFQMTAMVDIVFMLLAFFVLASQFRMPERDFAMGYSDSGAPVTGTLREDFPTQIAVQLRRSGASVAISIAQTPIAVNDFDAIRRTLTRINMPEIPVRIIAESSLRVGQVTKAMDAVLASPMTNVSVSRLDVPKT